MTVVPPAPIDRRRALSLLAGTLLATTGLPDLGLIARTDELTSWLAERFGALDWSELRAPVQSLHPTATPSSLSAEVLAGRRRGESVATHLARKVAAEFAAGRMVDLAGWRLAETEGRLLALLLVPTR